MSAEKKKRTSKSTVKRSSSKKRSASGHDAPHSSGKHELELESPEGIEEPSEVKHDEGDLVESEPVPAWIDNPPPKPIDSPPAQVQKPGFMSRFSGMFGRNKNNGGEKPAASPPVAPPIMPSEADQVAAVTVAPAAPALAQEVEPVTVDFVPTETTPTEPASSTEATYEGVAVGQPVVPDPVAEVAVQEPTPIAEPEPVELKVEPKLEMPVPSHEETQGMVLSQVKTAKMEQTSKPSMAVPLVRPASKGLEKPDITKSPSGLTFVTRYQIYPDNPDVYVGVVRDSETGGYRYIVVEPRMTLIEQQVYAKLTRLLVDELEVDMARLRNSKVAQSYLYEEVKKLAKKYDFKVSQDSYRKLTYYFTRDYIKLGRIEVLMNDPRIEDISCDGPKIPLFIWHRDYESIPTNVVFKSDDELNTFASKLAYVSGKHISIAQPIVDASLPDGSRIQITYGKEVTRKGSTFTIRKFKGDPITIVDMLKYNTLSPELGAYLWYLIEKRMSLLVAGGTASGKSIPYDEKVHVYQNGKRRAVSIGQLYDECALSAPSRREDEYEVLKAQNIETLAFDSDLKVGIFPVVSIIRHRTEKTVFRIKTRGGREVRTTGDHSIYVSFEGRALPCPVSKLRAGMCTAVPSSIPEKPSRIVGLAGRGLTREIQIPLAGVSLAWDEVIEVEEVDYSGDYVYDLEVPRAQNFVGGDAGVFLHNTTTLNALSMFIPPDQKIVSVEDTPELNLSHKNWIQSISRGGGVAGEITLFDLLKAALRQRPDIIIVGEVRGVEAFTLFQAIASVTGDTPVLVREEGQVKLTPIGELVDAFYSGNEERVAKHITGKEVLSFEKSGAVKFSPIQYVLRHSTDEAFTVSYAGGRVRATGSHSVFVFDERGRVVAKPVSALTPEDIMVSFCGSELDRQQPVLDAEAILRKVEGHAVITEKPRPSCPHCAATGAKLKGHLGSLQRYQCHDCGKAFKESPELVFTNLLSGSGGSMVSCERSLAVPKTMTVDEEFARVLGIYLADGCVKTHKGSSWVVFCLGSGEKSLFAEDAVRFFGKFGSSPSIEDRGTYVMLEFNHSPLAEVFRELCGARLEEKRVPSFMWNAPTSVVQSFLSGWEADGRRTLKKRRSVPISSVRKDLVDSISWLARLNSRTTYISERGSKYPSVYVSKLHEDSRADAIPAQPLLSLKAMLDSTAWMHMPKKSNKTISKRRAERALQEIILTARREMDWEAAQMVSTISSLIEGSIIASRVLGVEKTAFGGFVYDISVPGTEAFFGGDSPVALHNTGHGGLGTIHADSVEAAINRITSEPMNVPKSLLGSTLDCLIMQLRIKLRDKSVRRMVHVAEIVGHESSTDQIVLNNAFKWDPVSDQYIFSGRSRLFEKITKRYGTTQEKIRQDVEDRKIFLQWLMTKNIRDYRDVSQQIREFYSNKEETIERAMRALESGKP